MTKDRNAARRIRELRIDRGLTPEGLSYEVQKVAPGFPVSGRTIRRIEGEHVVPSVRVMFGIAAVFGMVPSQIWAPASKRGKVAA